MKILAIESSCDDTSVALVHAHEGMFDILNEKTASQIDIHKKYGGVVPEVAGRKHADTILPVIQEVMEGHDKPDYIAVTSGPGLITGLLVGVEAAKNLSYLWRIPLIGVNHIEGHIHSVLLQEKEKGGQSYTVQFPAVCLIVSGGHTELILMKDHGEYELIGKTVDDAAGEAFDKVAKLLGFDYPGGPKISKQAEHGDPTAISFPRPMLDKDNYQFSYAGLKTAALYWLRDNAKKMGNHYWLAPQSLKDFCASFEQAAIDVLVHKTVKAAQQYNATSVILAGGVSANRKLRRSLEAALTDITYYIPSTQYAMDNAAMIAVAASYKVAREECTPWQELIANPNWKVYESH